MAALAKLSGSSEGCADQAALADRLAEQQLVAEVQGNMLDALTAPQPFEAEVLKTIAVFRKNAEDDRKLLQAVIAKNQSLEEQLAASESRYKEKEKMHAAEKQEQMKVINEQSARINELEARQLTLEGRVKEVDGETTKLKGRFDIHAHAIATTRSTVKDRYGGVIHVNYIKSYSEGPNV